MKSIDINTSPKEDLIKIIHIGNKRADMIINKRSSNKFKDLYELSSIKGFGKSRIDDIIREGILTV